MKLLIPFCNYELLLSAEQLERILDIVAGSERLERNYKGAGKGFFGNDASYELKFGTFSIEHVTVNLMTQETIDKYKALSAMRNNDQGA